jgi:hypothetical protein
MNKLKQCNINIKTFWNNLIFVIKNILKHKNLFSILWKRNKTTRFKNYNYTKNNVNNGKITIYKNQIVKMVKENKFYTPNIDWICHHKYVISISYIFLFFFIIKFYFFDDLKKNYNNLNLKFGILLSQLKLKNWILYIYIYYKLNFIYYKYIICQDVWKQ